MKIALVYDRVNKFGGAERVLLALDKIWPSAPLYTAVYSPQGAPWAKGFKVKPSFVQKVPWAKEHHQLYPWLMPLAFESFDFSDFDLVVSLTSAEAKGIITKPKTFHLCYCLTPTRYLWSSYQHYLDHPQFGWLNPLVKPAMKPILTGLRTWDRVAGQRPDHYLAISQEVKGRIGKYYQREAEVVYPPVDVDQFKPAGSVGSLRRAVKRAGYFLVVSRLVSYKRIDLVVEAFNELGLALKIIGGGPEKRALEKKAKGNIQFLGQNLTDKQLLGYYQNCLGLVFAGKEDFGLVSLEAQACGKPVIAYRGGGIKETIIEKKTGLLFSRQTAGDLARAVKHFDPADFKTEDCRRNAERFSQKKFIKKFRQAVEEAWQQYQNTK